MENLGLLDFIIGSSQIKSGSSNLWLEFNLFSFQLVNSFLEINNGLVFISSQSIDGVNHFVSEFL
jgi:hypothetical protein